MIANGVRGYWRLSQMRYSPWRLHLQVERFRLRHLAHSSAALVSHFTVESAPVRGEVYPIYGNKVIT